MASENDGVDIGEDIGVPPTGQTGEEVDLSLLRLFHDPNGSFGVIEVSRCQTGGEPFPPVTQAAISI